MGRRRSLGANLISYRPQPDLSISSKMTELWHGKSRRLEKMATEIVSSAVSSSIGQPLLLWASRASAAAHSPVGISSLCHHNRRND